MSKAIVIYTSARGSTEQYAKWIAEELGCEAVDFSSAKGLSLYEYDCIIYGGWIRGSGIVGFDKFKKLFPKELRERLIVFGVGVARESTENYMQVYDINYKKFAREGAKNPTLYILSGAYDPAGVEGLDKFLMGIMKKVLISGSTPDASSEAEAMRDRIENGVNLVDRNNISALVAEAKSIIGE
ncbi:MAG: hypothetical protein HUJ78_04930 [Mogibacterium sp.]|nr:hypothetical protein [Mogibacterium sp.]